MTRILHIIPYFGPAFAYGGTIRAAYDLAVRLAKRGHDQLVLTTDAYNADNRLPAGPTDVDGVPARRIKNASNWLAWRRVFLPVGFGRAVGEVIADYDVVHLHEVRSMLNAAALPHLLKHRKPYIVTPQGGLPKELRRAGYKQLFDAWVGDRLLRHADRLHALTEMERQQYLDMGLPDEKVFISPNGIDVTEYDFEVDVAAFKATYNIPPDRPVVGFLARLNVIKGVDFLVEAFARTTHPEAVLMLVGPDDGDQANIEALVARLGLTERVIFTGYIAGVEEKAAAYRAADVYVLSSRYDIQGITPLEALLNRTPTIVTERCGLATYFDEQNIARVVDFGDVDGLAATIDDMLTYPQHAQQQADRGREQIIADFNWPKLVDGWEDIYRTLSEG